MLRSSAMRSFGSECEKRTRAEVAAGVESERVWKMGGRRVGIGDEPR